MALIAGVAKRLFGSSNDRMLKSVGRPVDEINALEAEFEALSDDQLKAKADEFRARLAGAEDLDDLLAEAFAAVREASKRTLGQRHFDVQLMGGYFLHKGMITEMKTGEGKTLVATLPCYLNALTDKGVHVVTVNDYLAQRDAAWMGQIYSFLGLTVGCIVHGLSDEERRAAYAADVTYGTNNEYGFDYLRDNMKFERSAMSQRPFNFAIIDEVDSILIDEARTPLIISGPSDDASELYRVVNELVVKIEEGDYEKDEKQRTATYSEQGTERIEDLLREADLLRGEGLYDIENVSAVHHANQALRAHVLFSRDVDYVVKDDQVYIVDEFTGRMMEGRRYSDGLHQALEAKEGVTIQPENQTVASITFQNYFRLYPKLAGMTGTAVTEAAEFGETYKLQVVEIPTHMDMIRIDNDDEVYRTAAEKHDAILSQVEECRERGQPILVGTVSIEKSEVLSELLEKRKIPHNVLNARHHAQEAHIIAQAGRFGGVTIATNMAGRGTDIQLGGNMDMRLNDEALDEDGNLIETKAKKISREIEEEKGRVLAAGGLFIIGTERHESRRIDNQLRGRSGRQGDPGASLFYLSLEDDLMRIFGSERLDGMLQKLGLEEGEAIVHPWINKALEKAQEKVEARNFDIRKNLLRFDDVMNDQRKVIYEQRLELMDTDDVSEQVADMRHTVIDDLVDKYIPEKAYAEQWDAQGLRQRVVEIFAFDLPVDEWAAEEGIADEEIRDRIAKDVDRQMAEKTANFGRENMRALEKSVLLQILDHAWKEHLLGLDHLRSSIGLRGYAQRDPLNEYKHEGFRMFEALLDQLRESVTQFLAHLELQQEAQASPFAAAGDGELEAIHADPPTGENEASEQPLRAAPRATRRQASQVDPDDPSTWGRVSRNATCPCGSGRKYKHCHGKLR